jgi:hypothetical protein
MLAVILLCLASTRCDRAHAVSVMSAPCASAVPTACLLEAQQRLAATAMGRDMTGLTVRVGVECVKHRIEAAQ